MLILIKHLLGSISRDIPKVHILGLYQGLKLIKCNLLRIIAPPCSQNDVNQQVYNLLDKKHEIIRKFIDSTYCNNIVRNLPENESNPYKDKIWVFWWQGITSMPDVVSVCFKSLKNHSNGHEVILIDKYNYSKYVDVPNEIMSLVVAGKMSLAHLSDFVRLQLLSRYGGLWVDSTFYIISDIPNDIFEYDFYSIRTHGKDNNCVGKYRYFVSFMACKPYNAIIYNTYLIFSNYWISHDTALDYLFMDYCIDYVCIVDETCSKQLKSIPYNNEHTLDYLKHINDPFDMVLLSKWKEDTFAFKLNWKVRLCKEVNGRTTFYGYMYL